MGGYWLLDGDFGAGDGTAAEEADFALFVGHDAVFGGVDSVVAAHLGTGAGSLGLAGLADDDLADLDFGAAKQLNP